MCEACTLTRASVNDNILDFGDLLKHVLNGSFTMTLPTSFKVIHVESKTEVGTDKNPSAAAGQERTKQLKRQRTKAKE